MRLSLLMIYLIWGSHAPAQNALIDKGNQFYHQGQYGLAEVQYQMALRDSPTSLTAQYNLANALHMQKKWDKAIEGFNQVIAGTGDARLKAAAWYNKGVAYSQQKSLEESIEAYKTALRFDPADNNARENLQKALLELKKKQSNSQQQKQNQKKLSIYSLN